MLYIHTRKWIPVRCKEREPELDVAHSTYGILSARQALLINRVALNVKLIVWLVVVMVYLCASCTAAGELSDSLIFGDIVDESAHSVQGGSGEVVTALVGTISESTPCRISLSSLNSAFQIDLVKQPGQTFTVQIQEVYPPDSPGVRYTYRIDASGRTIYSRDHVGLMCGTTSYFVNVDDPALVSASRITLSFTNLRSGSPFRIAAVWLYSDFSSYLTTSRFSTPFYLTPLVKEATSDLGVEQEVSYLKANLHPSISDVRLGFSAEHYYMLRDADTSWAEFQRYLSYGKLYEMAYLPLFVSWWGGTPNNDDAYGGHFTDPQYQQVCWSDTDTYDEGQSLKDLLGSRWDLRYGWTVPNAWSNTPWLTMNSPVLNDARAKAIGSNLLLLDSVVDSANMGFADYLLGIAMENEPRYWDYQCPDAGYYPVLRQNLGGDYNPLVVADAARDGIVLDPADGLTYAERLWLHSNVANYMQQTYEAYALYLKSLNMSFVHSSVDSPWHEVYSHGSTGSLFPMGPVTTYHPGMEWNRLQGCRAGLEGLAHPAAGYLSRAREWGRWAQVNSEENTGTSTSLHLRDLRACYAFGARFYNFYNWQAVNSAGAWTSYVQSFCADGNRYLVRQITAQPTAKYSSVSSISFTISIPSSCPVINEIDLTLNTPADYIVQVYDSSSRGRLLAYRRKTIATTGLAVFDLPNCVSTDTWTAPYVSIARADGQQFSVYVSSGNAAIYSVWADVVRERTQSLLVSWRTDAQTLLSELADKQPPGLNLAYQAFAAGDYRGAYESAIPIDKNITDIVIDNHDVNCTLTGSWQRLVPTSGQYREDYLRAPTSASQTATATWRPSIVLSGHYDVAVWYPPYSNRSSLAPYTIVHRGDSATVPVDQTSGCGNWVTIASGIPFDAGTTGCVILGNRTGEIGKYVNADAVRFRYVSPLAELVAPIINAVSCSPAMVVGANPVCVVVDTADDTGVTVVTANGVSLTNSEGNIWTGVIQADSSAGQHSITVIALDAGGNSATDTSLSYGTGLVVGIGNESLLSPTASLMAGKLLFRIWGVVTTVGTDGFVISDGSNSPVTVYCPGHSIAKNDFVIACGIWDPTGKPALLKCQISQVRKV